MSHWTPDEIRLLDYYDNATVAKLTGRSENAVANKRAMAKRYEPFTLTKCAVCGKLFYMPDPGAWVYKRQHNGRLKHLCSYHCLRTWDNGHKGKEKAFE